MFFGAHQSGLIRQLKDLESHKIVYSHYSSINDMATVVASKLMSEKIVSVARGKLNLGQEHWA